MNYSRGDIVIVPFLQKIVSRKVGQLTSQEMKEVDLKISKSLGLR